MGQVQEEELGEEQGQVLVKLPKVQDPRELQDQGERLLEEEPIQPRRECLKVSLLMQQVGQKELEQGDSMASKMEEVEVVEEVVLGMEVSLQVGKEVVVVEGNHMAVVEASHMAGVGVASRTGKDQEEAGNMGIVGLLWL